MSRQTNRLSRRGFLKGAAAAINAHLEKTRTSAAERHVREAAQRGLAAAR